MCFRYLYQAQLVCGLSWAQAQAVPGVDPVAVITLDLAHTLESIYECCTGGQLGSISNKAQEVQDRKLCFERRKTQTRRRCWCKNTYIFMECIPCQSAIVVPILVAAHVFKSEQQQQNCCACLPVPTAVATTSGELGRPNQQTGKEGA